MPCVLKLMPCWVSMTTPIDQGCKRQCDWQFCHTQSMEMRKIPTTALISEIRSQCFWLSVFCFLFRDEHGRFVCQQVSWFQLWEKPICSTTPLLYSRLTTESWPWTTSSSTRCPCLKAVPMFPYCSWDLVWCRACRSTSSFHWLIYIPLFWVRKWTKSTRA